MNDSNQIFLIPREGVLVIKPDTNTPLNAKGEMVENTSYYRRRVADGDASIGEPPAKASSKK